MRRGTHSIITVDGVTRANTILNPGMVASLAAQLAGRGERIVPVRDDPPSRSGHEPRDESTRRTYDLDVT